MIKALTHSFTGTFTCSSRVALRALNHNYNGQSIAEIISHNTQTQHCELRLGPTMTPRPHDIIKGPSSYNQLQNIYSHFPGVGALLDNFEFPGVGAFLDNLEFPGVGALLDNFEFPGIGALLDNFEFPGVGALLDNFEFPGVGALLGNLEFPGVGALLGNLEFPGVGAFLTTSRTFR